MHDEYIVKALKIGVKGYILKQNFESIVPSLSAVYFGQSVFGEDIVSKIPSFFNGSGKADFSLSTLMKRNLKLLSS